ncbi:hypothetical protein DL765_009919 [Monosporascus sp. GIB2]|nr:hypothetical protein DL765_009919 [Monosporascus sp. GIB2]
MTVQHESNSLKLNSRIWSAFELRGRGSMAKEKSLLTAASPLSRILETRRFPLRGGLGRLQRPRSVSAFSLTGLASLTRALFGDHTKALQPKPAVSVELLAETPLISTDTLLRRTSVLAPSKTWSSFYPSKISL